MYIQGPALLLLGLLATAGSAPLNTDRRLTEGSLSQAAEKRHGYELPDEAEITKREDIKNLAPIVKYSNDEIAKREADNDVILTKIVKYTDDEITA